jgi:hypothetical protein
VDQYYRKVGRIDDRAAHQTKGISRKKVAFLVLLSFCVTTTKMAKKTSTEKKSSEKKDGGKKGKPAKSEDADAAQSKVQSSSSSL